MLRGKKGFIPFVLTAGLLLALALVLAVVFAGGILTTWVLSKNILPLTGAAIIVLSIVLMRNVNPWVIGVGAMMILVPFAADKLDGMSLQALEIFPDYEGVSILTADGKSHFEVGDKFGRITGSVPERIEYGGAPVGFSGDVMGWEVYADGQLISCSDISYGNWNRCYCNPGDARPTGNYKFHVFACSGYTANSDCVSVCQKPALPVNKDFVFTKDTQMLVRFVVPVYETSSSNKDDFFSMRTFSTEFMLPVYQPKTIEKYVLVDCQTTNPNSEGYCEGTCESNICNIRTAITDYDVVDEKDVPEDTTPWYLKLWYWVKSLFY